MKRKFEESAVAGGLAGAAAWGFMDNRAPIQIMGKGIPAPLVHGVAVAGIDMLASYGVDAVSKVIDKKGKMENILHPLAVGGATYGATKLSAEYDAWANKNNNTLLTVGTAGGAAFLAEMAVDFASGKGKNKK